MKSNKKKTRKSFFDLTDEERERELSRFDREIDIEKDTKPLSVKQRAIHDQLRGYPRGVYPLALDPKLLGAATKAARKKGVTLDQFIAESIRGMVAFSRL